jgi:hypothetical protein
MGLVDWISGRISQKDSSILKIMNFIYENPSTLNSDRLKDKFGVTAYSYFSQFCLFEGGYAVYNDRGCRLTSRGVQEFFRLKSDIHQRTFNALLCFFAFLSLAIAGISSYTLYKQGETQNSLTQLQLAQDRHIGNLRIIVRGPVSYVLPAINGSNWPIMEVLGIVISGEPADYNISIVNIGTGSAELGDVTVNQCCNLADNTSTCGTVFMPQLLMKEVLLPGERIQRSIKIPSFGMACHLNFIFQMSEEGVGSTSKIYSMDVLVNRASNSSSPV